MNERPMNESPMNERPMDGSPVNERSDRAADDSGLRTLVARVRADLRDGRAGALVRIGLSAAAAGLVVSGLMLSLGMLQAGGVHIDEEHAMGGLALSVGVWAVILFRLWSTYHRWRRILSTAFILLCIWAATLGVSVGLQALARDVEFLIAAVIFFAVGLSIAVVTTAAYRGWGGRAVVSPDGAVEVRCPGCGYSLVGLDSAACPECGSRHTLEELIRAQDYDAWRRAGELRTGIAPRLAGRAG